MKGRHTVIKIILIVVAEAMAMLLTNFVSDRVVPIPHTTLSYLVCGAILAYVIVALYDKMLDIRKRRIEQELKMITDAALMKYEVQERKQ